MKNKQIKSNNSSALIDVLAAVFALLFVVSAINNVHDFVQLQIQNAPASYALIISLGLIIVSWFNNKKLTILKIATITGIVTAIAIWGFGLHGWLR